MHRLPRLLSAAGIAFAATLPAQNHVPNGDFERGTASWTLTAFNDPLGSTGVGVARVGPHGPSATLFADFQTITSVRSATFRSAVVTLPQTTLPVSFQVMWEKQVTTPIPSVTVNRVELRVFDASNTQVFLATRNAPNQTGLQERATWLGTFTVPAAGQYSFELFLRHSNLANMPYTTWVDEVVVGAPVAFVYGQGCVGEGGILPLINRRNSPDRNSGNFSINLYDATGGPTVAFFVMDISRTQAGGLPLPFALGGGCNLLAGTTVFLPHLLQGAGPGTGTAVQVLPIPDNPGLGGVELFAQYGVLDFTAQNPFGLVTTAGLAFTIQ